MDRKLFGFLSGWQFTVLASVAIVAPSALYAVTYTAVGIIDPNSGAMSYVDPAHKLWVYDPVVGYANSPGNFVNAARAVSVNNTETVYTVPSGKAFILKSAGYVTYGNTSGSNLYGYIANGASNQFDGFQSLQPSDTFNHDLGSGAVFRSGDTVQLGVFGNSGGATVFLRGYLVPATTLPTPGSPQAAAQFVSIGKTWQHPPGR